MYSNLNSVVCVGPEYTIIVTFVEDLSIKWSMRQYINIVPTLTFWLPTSYQHFWMINFSLLRKIFNDFFNNINNYNKSSSYSKWVPKVARKQRTNLPDIP